MRSQPREQRRFYGRSSEIQQAVERLRQHNFLAVIGPSGSGKSSLLAAGILPALEKSHYFAGTHWITQIIRPGTKPYDTLAAILRKRKKTTSNTGFHIPQIPDGTRLLVVVDQYEELYTVASSEQQGEFEQALLQLTTAPRCYVIVAARADFYVHLMGSLLWRQIQDHRLEITPPRGDALRQAIALPARDVGLEIETALVERLLADAGDEPGVLPFIQETLVRLWSHANYLSIDRRAYIDLVGDKIGQSGLQVALSGTRRACLPR